MVAKLRAAGVNVTATREPTDGPFGAEIRSSSKSGVTFSPDRELALFMADRSEHVKKLILPDLEQGKTVVTDRYFLSTVAYQGARGIPFEQILTDSERAFPIPTVAIVLSVPAEVGLSRVHSRGIGVNPVFERIDFLEHVSGIFRIIERPYIARVDGDRSIELVAEQVGRELSNRLGIDL